MMQRNLLGAAEGVMLLALCGALAWSWLTPQLHLRQTGWTPPEPLKSNLQALMPPPAAAPGRGGEERWLLTMQERPLFSMSRKPPPPVKKVEAPPPEPPDVWKDASVLGTFQGQASGAIVRLEGKDQRLMLNQSLGGWKLVGIQGRYIELERAGTKRTIDLKRAALDKGPNLPAGARAPTQRPSEPVAAQAAPEPAAADAPAPPQRTSRAVFGGSRAQRADKP